MNAQILDSGRYTPTLTNTTNVAASTAFELGYYRIGAAVHVFGKVDVDPTASGASTEIQMTLPIASNFGVNGQLAGVGLDGALSPVTIIADTTSDLARFLYTSSGTANTTIFFEFSYMVI